MHEQEKEMANPNELEVKSGNISKWCSNWRNVSENKTTLPMHFSKTENISLIWEQIFEI